MKAFMHPLLAGIIFGAFGCIPPLSGQIYLTNASFEGEPQDATVPVGWLPCQEGTTPDILPGPWGVFTEASDGETFVGLITRENGTWESIAQRLPQPLEKGTCYTFRLDVARSQTYAEYNQPIILRIWGGGRKCDQDQLLLETEAVEHLDWETLETQFTVKTPINYLLLEAYYPDPERIHRGNIILDNLTPIKKCARASLE